MTFNSWKLLVFLLFFNPLYSMEYESFSAAERPIDLEATYPRLAGVIAPQTVSEFGNELDRLAEENFNHATKLSWCVCANASKDTRINLILTILNDVLALFPTPQDRASKILSITDLGEAYCLQSYVLIRGLIHIGFNQIAINLINQKSDRMLKEKSLTLIELLKEAIYEPESVMHYSQELEHLLDKPKIDFLQGMAKDDRERRIEIYCARFFSGYPVFKQMFFEPGMVRIRNSFLRLSTKSEERIDLNEKYESLFKSQVYLIIDPPSKVRGEEYSNIVEATMYIKNNARYIKKIKYQPLNLRLDAVDIDIVGDTNMDDLLAKMDHDLPSTILIFSISSMFRDFSKLSKDAPLIYGLWDNKIHKNDEVFEIFP